MLPNPVWADAERDKTAINITTAKTLRVTFNGFPPELERFYVDMLLVLVFYFFDLPVAFPRNSTPLLV
jgi:hypothetical protein